MLIASSCVCKTGKEDRKELYVCLKNLIIMATVAAPGKLDAAPHNELDLYAGVDEFSSTANRVRLQ